MQSDVAVVTKNHKIAFNILQFRIKALWLYVVQFRTFLRHLASAQLALITAFVEFLQTYKPFPVFPFLILVSLAFTHPAGRKIKMEFPHPYHYSRVDSLKDYLSFRRVFKFVFFHSYFCFLEARETVTPPLPLPCFLYRPCHCFLYGHCGHFYLVRPFAKCKLAQRRAFGGRVAVGVTQFLSSGCAFVVSVELFYNLCP